MNSIDLEIGLSEGGGFPTVIECSSTDNTDDEVYFNSDLVPGELYYAAISSRTIATGTFNISVSEEPLVGDVIFVNDNATGNNTGNIWPNAFNNLQEALDSAERRNEVWVASGEPITLKVSLVVYKCQVR